MSIQQVKASYVASEDRILLRFNTSDAAEYRLWLTRRIALELLQEARTRSVSKIAADPKVATGQSAAQTIDAMQQENLRQQVDLKTQYQEGSRLPLGAEPMLVTKLALEQINDHTISLSLELVGKHTLNLRQPISILKTLRLAIERMVKTADWSNPSPDVTTPPIAAPGSRAVH